MRAILVTPASPWGPSFGAQQRTALLHEALAQLMPVDVLLLDEAGANEAEAGDRPEILAKLSWKQPGFTLYKYGVHPWANRWCHSEIDWAKYSLIVSRYLTPMTKVDWPRRLRTIVDCDDALYRYAPRADTRTARIAASARGWARFWQTRAAIRKYDHAFFCSPRDARLFPCRSSSILPNVVRAPLRAPGAPPGAGGTVLIVGSMWYGPNRRGVEWFLARCWPEIAARCPALALRIVGPAPPEDRLRWGRAPRTEAPGFVEDLEAEYARAFFAVAPIHYGGGTCIKFLEAAAFRRPCVVTEHVFAGFAPDFRDGYSVVVAPDPRRMVQACVEMFEGTERRSLIAQRAYETVTRLYTVERFSNTVQSAVRTLVGPAVACERNSGDRSAVTPRT